MTNEKLKRKYLQILSELEIEELFALPKFTDTERIYYFTLNPAEEAVVNRLIYVHSKVHFILQLGYFKAKFRLFNFSIKEVIVDAAYIISRYFAGEPTFNQLPSRNMITANNKRILGLMDYKNSPKIAVEILTDRLKFLVRNLSKPIIILKELLLYFKQKRVIFPEYTVMQNIIGKEIMLEEKRLQTIVDKHVPTDITKLLNNLLDADDIAETIVSLKQHPKNFNFMQIQQELEKHKAYYPLYQFAKHFLSMLGISQENIKYYASLVHYYNKYRLKELPRQLSYLYLLCYSYNRFQIMNDHLIQTLCHYVALYKAEAKKHAEKQVVEIYNNIYKHFKPAGYLLKMFLNPKLSRLAFKEIQKKAYKKLSKTKLKQVSKYLMEQCIDKTAYEWQFHANNYRCITKNLRPVFMAIDFECNTNNAPLLSGVRFIKQALQQNKNLNQIKFNEFPKQFVPEKLKKYIFEISKNKKQVNSYKYEFCVYNQLMLHIEKGLVFCNDTIQYKSFEADLGITTADNKEQILKDIDIPKLTTPIEKRLKALKEELENLYKITNENINNKSNKFVKVKEKNGKTTWTLPYKKKDLDFNNPIYDQLPHANIINVVDFVDRECNFIKEFMHVIASGTQKPDPQYVKGCLIANAINLGNYKLSENSNLLYHLLNATQINCFQLETIMKANKIVVKKTAALPIFKYYNPAQNKLHFSFDGEKLVAKYETFNAKYSSKYFGTEKGLVDLSMILNGLAVNFKIIGAHERESHYVFDMLFNNNTNLEPDWISGDMHLINRVNFALLDFRDIEFMPCYRSIPRQTKNLCGFKDLHYYKKYLIKPSHKINWQLIIDEWPNIQNIIAALMMKETTQHIIIKKLCSHKMRNKTREALWEYNNILMSIYLLKYINDNNMRRFVRTTINRGEEHHLLRSTVAIMGGGVLRGKSDLEIEIQNACAELMTNVVMYYNTYIMSQIMLKKEQQGNHEAVEFIKKLSMAASQHINFNGYFKFDVNSNPVNMESIIAKLDKVLGTTKEFDVSLYKKLG